MPVLIMSLLAIPPRGLAAQATVPARATQSDSITANASNSEKAKSRPSDRLPPIYRLQPYGSDANFNPLSMLVNRGFDVWRLEQFSPSLVRFPYKQSASSVWRAVTHPGEAIDRTGLWPFVRNEVLPLRWRKWRSAWMPNYTLHFFQGGVTYVRTEGWFADHGWPVPKLWAGATVFTAAYITEMAETGYGTAGSAAFADLVIFDLGGILVFNIPAVRNWVGKGRIMDWSLQPVFTPNGEIYNVSDYLTFKFGLPFTDKVDFLWRLGLGSWMGLSFAHGETDAVSIAVGGETINKIIDPTTLEESITVGTGAGIFYDRRGSLLASLEWGPARWFTLNIYPDVLPGPFGDMGLFFSLDREYRPRVGLIARALGVGIGLSHRGPNKYDAQQAGLN